MTAQKVLQADVNYLNKRLTQKHTAKDAVIKKISRHPFAYVESEHRILPYDKAALARQYFLVKELVADYIDNQQIALFDEAIRIFDEADLARKN